MFKLILFIFVLSSATAIAQHKNNTKIKKSSQAQKSINPLEIYTDVDTEAQFISPSDAKSTQLLMDAFDFSRIKAVDGGELKADISLVVNTDGSISDVSVTGDYTEFNDECLRAIQNTATLCKPAKINGQQVRSRYKTTILMHIE